MIHDQYGEYGQEEQYGQDGQEYMIQDENGQYAQYDEYGEYGPYDQNEEYDEYGKFEIYGQDQGSMDKGYLMSGNLQNIRTVNSAEQRKTNKRIHFCPIHGLYGHGKKGNKYGYIRSRKEIRRFKGFGGEKEGIRKIGRGYGKSMEGKRKESISEYIQGNINNNQGDNEEEVDNYKFYESKNVSKKSANNSVVTQDIVNYKKNMTGRRNIIGEEKKYGIGMNQKMKTLQLMKSNQGIQSIQSKGMGMKGSTGMKETQGSDYSKVYIATMITPVYSNYYNQQQYLNLNGRGICSVCGGNLSGLNQMTNNIQGVKKSCPIHAYSKI